LSGSVPRVYDSKSIFIYKNIPLILTVNEVTEIFYLGDEYSKEIEVSFKKHVLNSDNYLFVAVSKK